MRLRARSPVVAAALALSGVLVPTGSSDAREPARPSGLIAFDRTIDGAGRVALVRADGRGLRIVTPGAGHELPVWSPDGRAIASVAATVLSQSALDVSPVAAGRTRRLTTSAGLNAYPAWSPDGSTIAWTSEHGGHLSIWLMAADGSDARQLTHGWHDGDPAWSKDGSRLAFLDQETGALSVIERNGTQLRRVRAPAASSGPSAPSWSPDGRQIALAGADGALDAVSAATGGARPLTTASPSTTAWRPVWSPTGDEIAFLDLSRHGAVELVDASSRRRRVLAPRSDGLSAPSWSPDGRFVAYADAAGQIEVVAVDGGSNLIVTHGIARDADPAWQP